MGYNYTTQDSGGSSSGDYQLKVFVYPDESNDVDVCQNEVIPALIDACEQAYGNSSVIDYWEVSYSDDYPGEWESDSTDIDTVLTDWLNTLDNQSSVPTGSHLLVNSDRNGGVADGGDIVCDDSDPREDRRASWSDWSPALWGTEGESSDLIGNIAIQEAFHNFIDQCLPEVEDLTPQEHALGKIENNYYYGDNASTPMISSYEDEHPEEGDCQSSATWQDAYTTTLTDCTETALDETAKNHVHN